MFGDLDLPLNALRGLSAIAEFLVTVTQFTIVLIQAALGQALLECGHG